MRWLLAATACSLLCVLMASADIADDNGIRFYFSTSNGGYVPGGGGVWPAPTEYASQTTLTIVPGETVYLWCATQWFDRWIEIGADFASSGTNFDLTGEMYNPYGPQGSK